MYHNTVETKKLLLNVHINFSLQIGLLIRYPTQTSNQDNIQALYLTMFCFIHLMFYSIQNVFYFY
jgi:hypothetical protein